MPSPSIIPSLLIIGTSKDSHITEVITHLPESVSFCRFNVDEYPTVSDLNFRPCRSSRELSIKTQEDRYDLSNVSTVWFRRIGSPTIDPRISDSAHRGFARGEAESVVTSLAYLLEESKWISPYDASKRAASKLYQLRKANELGLTCPKTLITNQPSRARDFIQSSAKVIYKTIHSPSFNHGASRSLIFTHVIDEFDEALLDQVRLAPCIFQEYVEKEYELRITMVGTRMFPVAIDARHTATGKVDWRAALPEGLSYRVTTLPAEIEEKLLRFASEMELLYGAIDMIVTPQGEYVFLEINPHGAWGWLEQEVNIPISETLADYIVASLT